MAYLELLCDMAKTKFYPRLLLFCEDMSRLSSLRHRNTTVWTRNNFPSSVSKWREKIMIINKMK